MRYKLAALVAASLLSLLAIAGSAQAANYYFRYSMDWYTVTWAPSYVGSGFDSVSVELFTDDRVNSNFDTNGIRFTAVVSADQANTRVSIERVAISGTTRTLYVWGGERLGPTGIAQVGPSYPYSAPNGCYYRMRINYSVRWSNGQLVRYSWLTGWQHDYWVHGC